MWIDSQSLHPWSTFKRWFQKKFLGYVDPGVYIEEVPCPQTVSVKDERVLGIVGLKRTPCPILDPVKQVHVPDDTFWLTLIDPYFRHVGHNGVVKKTFSKDPKGYCSRCQTDHVQYTAIENLKASCCDEPVMIAEHFFVGPTGPIHRRCAHDHSEE